MKKTLIYFQTLFLTLSLFIFYTEKLRNILFYSSLSIEMRFISFIKFIKNFILIPDP